MTDTHVLDAPAVAWEYTGRDWRPLLIRTREHIITRSWRLAGWA